MTGKDHNWSYSLTPAQALPTEHCLPGGLVVGAGDLVFRALCSESPTPESVLVFRALNSVYISTNYEFNKTRDTIVRRRTRIDLQTLATERHAGDIGKSMGRLGNWSIFKSGDKPFCLTNSRQWSSVELLLRIASTKRILNTK